MRRFVDWHTHCCLPEHQTPAGAALQRLRNAAGSREPDPRQHRKLAASGERFRADAAPRAAARLVCRIQNAAWRRERSEAGAQVRSSSAYR